MIKGKMNLRVLTLSLCLLSMSAPLPRPAAAGPPDSRHKKAGSGAVEAGAAAAKLTLSPGVLFIGAPPSVLKVSGGLPTYQVRQTGGTVGVNLNRTAVDTFNVSARIPGTAVISLVDQRNNILASTTLAIKRAAVTMTLAPEILSTGSAPAVLKVTGASAPLSLRQTAGNAKLEIRQRGADTFDLVPQAPGSATVTLFDRGNNPVGSKMVSIAGPKASITLSPEAIGTGQTPALLKVAGGAPPFTARQTGGNAGVRIQQSGPDSFSLFPQGPGTVTVSVFDRTNSNLGSRTLTVGATPLNVSLSMDSILVKQQPAVLKITSGIPPYYVRQTGGNVGVGIQQTAADQFKIYGREPGTAVLTIGDQFSGRSTTRNITVR